MELTKKQIKITKGVAILLMLLLHLFCTKTYQGLFEPLIVIGSVPLVYYFALFGDCCVAIYCFCSGYGLLLSYKRNQERYMRNNFKRLFKLYINFWIILLLFVVILGPVLGKGDIYPGSLKTFLLTATAIDPGYNGAWWFLTTYIILVCMSPIINKLVRKYPPILLVGLSFVIYFIGYLQRIKGIIVVEDEVLAWLLRQAGLWGTSQFPFVIGVIFAEKKIYSKIGQMIQGVRVRNIVGIGTIISMIIAHGIVQTMFVAPFTGIIFIVVFNLMSKPKGLEWILDCLSNHSTNMWLVHMFFYMIYFKGLTFLPKYPVVIFIWLVILCLVASYIINWIYKPIVRWIDK